VQITQVCAAGRGGLFAGRLAGAADRCRGDDGRRPGADRLLRHRDPVCLLFARGPGLPPPQVIYILSLYIITPAWLTACPQLQDPTAAVLLLRCMHQGVGTRVKLIVSLLPASCTWVASWGPPSAAS
jgi:hypothetical protein